MSIYDEHIEDHNVICWWCSISDGRSWHVHWSQHLSAVFDPAINLLLHFFWNILFCWIRCLLHHSIAYYGHHRLWDEFNIGPHFSTFSYSAAGKSIFLTLTTDSKRKLKSCQKKWLDEVVLMVSILFAAWITLQFAFCKKQQSNEEELLMNATVYLLIYPPCMNYR